LDEFLNSLPMERRRAPPLGKGLEIEVKRSSVSHCGNNRWSPWTDISRSISLQCTRATLVTRSCT